MFFLLLLANIDIISPSAPGAFQDGTWSWGHGGSGMGQKMGRPWARFSFFLFLKGRNDDKKTIRLELRLSLVDFFGNLNRGSFLGAMMRKNTPASIPIGASRVPWTPRGLEGFNRPSRKEIWGILLKLKKNGKNPRKWLVHGLYSCNHSGRETHRFEANKKRMWRARSREVVTKPGDDRW